MATNYYSYTDSEDDRCTIFIMDAAYDTDCYTLVVDAPHNLILIPKDILNNIDTLVHTDNSLDNALVIEYRGGSTFTRFGHKWYANVSHEWYEHDELVRILDNPEDFKVTLWKEGVPND